MRLTRPLHSERPCRRPDARPIPDWLIALSVVIVMVLIFWLDRVTGSAPVQHLYYVPIVVTAIVFGLWPSMAIAMVAIGLYHLGGELRHFHYTEADIIKIALFVGMGVVAARLADDNKRLRQLAMTDDLTALHNLRAFEARLLDMVNDARRRALPLAMIVLDVDRLKELNDRYGHLLGAEAVRMVGHLIGRALPASSVACRYGGDEFAIALLGQDEVTACKWADNLRLTIFATAPTLIGQKWPGGTLSVSVGVACLCSADQNTGSPDDAGEALFQEADKALYRAKSQGRNRVFAWSSKEGA